MRRSTEHAPHVGGQHFTTEPLDFPAGKSTAEQVRVVWDNAQCWRLQSLAEGQEPFSLPGKHAYITRSSVPQMARRNRSIIVVGNWSSGLSSFHNWLVSEGPILSLDLDWVQRSEETPMGRIGRAAERLAKEIDLTLSRTEPKDVITESQEKRRKLKVLAAKDTDPIDIVETIAREYSDVIKGIVFRNFEALELETKKRLFGRLRRLYDEADRPMRKLPIFLLGHSYLALDPIMTEPGSNLLPFSYFFTLPSLTPDEIQKMAEKLPAKDGRLTLDTSQLDRIRDWTGGHPLILQALFRLIATHGETLALGDAIGLLERDRPRVFATWVRGLKELLGGDPEIERIIHILLREARYPRRRVQSRFAIEVLFIQGWISFDPPEFDPSRDQMLIWRSDCHRMLAGEAYARRERE